MAPYVGLSVFEEAVARARQRLLVNGPILPGNPVAPAPEEDGGVDTTLRPSLTPPDASGRQAK